MPWWLLGISMVATTFSTDTPNLVTDLVRRDGVSGNWGVGGLFVLTGDAYRICICKTLASIWCSY